MITSDACALAHAVDEQLFGGKAAQLAVAAAAGLPVPAGVALSHALVAAVACGDPGTIAQMHSALTAVAPPFAVRSSAIGEDSKLASFAGQHATRLGVGPQEVAEAVRQVVASTGSAAALAYRRRVGVEEDTRTGVVVQRMVPADVSGVLFTRNPLDGSDERVIEASWGLGPVVVEGLVIPDRFRVERGGRVSERVAGHKDVAIEFFDGDGIFEHPVSAARVETLCLDDDQLAELNALASACEQVLGHERDIEFAFAAGTLYLLQSRPLTR